MSARLSFTRSIVSVAVVSAATLLAGGWLLLSSLTRCAPIAPPKSVDLGKGGTGQKLYFDPRLSKSGFISCNSCHNLSMGARTTSEPPSVTSGSKAPSTHPRCSIPV